MRHFFIQMVSDSKCPHTEEFFSCLVRLEDLKLTVPMKRERLVLKWLMNTDWSRGVEALLHANRINFELFKRGKEEYALSVDKKNSREKDDFVLEDLSGTSESFPTELSIITEEKTVNQGGSTPFAKEVIWKTRVIFRFFFFPIMGRARFEDRSLGLSKKRSK